MLSLRIPYTTFCNSICDYLYYILLYLWILCIHVYMNLCWAMTSYTSEKNPELNDRLKLNIRHHLVNSMLGILQPISENGKILLFSIQYGFFVFLKLWCCFCLLKKESKIHHNICVNTLSMETSYSRISHSKVPILKKKIKYTATD